MAPQYTSAPHVLRGNPTNESVYAFYDYRQLTPATVVANQAIANSGDGYLFVLLNEQIIPGDLLFGVDFSVVWEGIFYFTCDYNGFAELILHTVHNIGALNFTHKRMVYSQRIGRNNPNLFLLSRMNSRSLVLEQKYTIGGKEVDITQTLLAEEVKISYCLEILAWNNGHTRRITGNVNNLRVADCEQTAFQHRN